MVDKSLEDLLEGALSARESLFDDRHQTGFRLFNGFIEGNPGLVIDLYAQTALIHNYAEIPSDGESAVEAARNFVRARLPWVRCILLKTRNGRTPQEKQGILVYPQGAVGSGTTPDDRLREHGIWYALDLLMNRDASLYLDMRNLRRWAIEKLQGKSVLNTFAYTGSLGVAAQAGGASRVVHVDLNRAFLNVAKASYTLNGFPIHKKDFQAADFWPQVNHLKRAGESFDCVFLDPPFFASTPKGVVDLQTDSARLINKVRPLVKDGGLLVAINNAIFLSGKEYMQTLESLCADGYLEIEKLIPISEDFSGYPGTRVGSPPVDPAPFNHTTKIAVLRVRRKASAKLE
jgi:23S rRNA (cytosine1962-C5)-methyltransferase